MGYSDFQVTDDLSAKLTKELSKRAYKVLDLEVIQADDGYAAVAYAAVESYEAEGRKVRGIACLLRFDPKAGPESFLLKEMWEEEGPVSCECPERILDLLTPTQDWRANDWRERCREFALEAALDAEESPAPGMMN